MTAKINRTLFPKKHAESRHVSLYNTWIVMREYCLGPRYNNWAAERGNRGRIKYPNQTVDRDPAKKYDLGSQYGRRKS
jgi:hypothetical protein